VEKAKQQLLALAEEKVCRNVLTTADLAKLATILPGWRRCLDWGSEFLLNMKGFSICLKTLKLARVSIKLTSINYVVINIIFLFSKQRVTLRSCMQSQNTTSFSSEKVVETSVRFVTAPGPESSSPHLTTKTRNWSLWLGQRKQWGRPRKSWRNWSRVW